MIIQSENISKEEFVRNILERDVRNIYRAQHLIVSRRVYLEGKELKAKQRKKGLRRRTGTLERSLAAPNYMMRSEGENFKLAAHYPIYTRFLDMKHLGNWKLYNRPVYGILYNNAMKDIEQNYGEAIRNAVGTALQNAFTKYNR